jgi:transcriptional regulator with XRE-family HTH domain
MSQFGELLRDFRKRSKLSQEKLGALLGLELDINGFSGAAVSDWERGMSKIHADDRLMLVSLIKVLYQCGGVISLVDANHLLEAGNYRALSQIEIEKINPNWHLPQGIDNPLLVDTSILNGLLNSDTRAIASTPTEKTEQKNPKGETDLPSTNLPSKLYTKLIGRDSEVENILASLRNPHGKKLLGIHGMGGIGKSALAREVSEKIQEEHTFPGLWWTTAKQQSLEALDELSLDQAVSYDILVNRLSSWLGLNVVLWEQKPSVELEKAITKSLLEFPCLIVLDNLETAIDQNLIAQKMGLLLEKTSSRAILTSREAWNISTTFMEPIPLKGLDESNAVRLMLTRAKDLKAANVLSATESQLREVASAVGTMPLALKLIVGLLQNFDIPTVLDDLEKLGSKRINRLYDYLFAHSWMTLEDEEKDLLIAISMYDEEEGIRASLLHESKVVPKNHFIDVMERLIIKSLVEVSNRVSDRYYILHPLTINFIRAQVE